jgi:hypothetical protein
MGKRKAKSGMTGLSKFLAAFNQDRTEEQPTHNLNFSLGSNQGQTPKNLGLRYDATGLVPIYKHLSEVPEHLKKCIPNYSLPFDIS